MICYHNGEKTDAAPEGGGNWLVFGSLASEPGLFSALGLDDETAAEIKELHIGHFESRAGHIRVTVVRPRSGGGVHGKTALRLSPGMLVIAFDSDRQMEHISGLLSDAAKKADNAMTAVRFFDALTAHDAAALRALEGQIEQLEEKIVAGGDPKDMNREIGRERKKLLICKRYYEQLLDILDDMSENENGLLTEAAVKRLKTLSDKFDRSYHNILNMQEYLSQVRDEYQAQIDISLNQTMKIFTVISAVFLPLTLVVGWYGMNFQIPEYGWKFGYLGVAMLSAAITGTCLFIFKKKKWF